MANYILRSPTLKLRTGSSRSIIYARITQGVFPELVSYVAPAAGWAEYEDHDIDRPLHRRARVPIAVSLSAVLKRKRPVAIFMFLLFAAGFLVRIWGLSKSHYWDEMVYLQNAQVICCGKTNYSELDFRPPLLSLIFAGVFLVWHHIYAACIATAVVNALGPIFLFFAGRLSLGPLPATISSLLLAFSPFFIGVFPSDFISDDTGNSLLTDSPALTLILLGFWLLLRALKRPTTFNFFIAGLDLALCVLMRFGSLPSVGMLLLLPLASRSRWKAIIVCVSGLAAGTAPYLLWSKLAFGEFLFTLKAGWEHVEGPEESFTFYIRNAGTIFTYLAILGLLLSAVSQLDHVRTALRKLRASHVRPASISFRSIVIGYMWLWLVLGLLFFSCMPHKEPRYILPLAPPVLLLASRGLSLLCGLSNRPLRTVGTWFLCIGLVLTFLPIRARLREPFLNSTIPDEEIASRFLDSHVPANTSLYMSFNYPVFAFYTAFRIHELSSVGTDLYRDMDRIPLGQVLIVYRQAEAPSQSDTAWVDANPRFRRLAEYPSLVIYRSITPRTQQEP